MLVITVIMCVENTVQLINARQDNYIRRNNDVVDDVYQLDVNWLSQRIYKLANDELDAARLFLINYVNWLFELPSEEQRSVHFNHAVSALCGHYIYYDADRNSLARVRQIYQRHLEQLSPKVLNALNIQPVPSELSGIPLCLWYMYQYGVEMPIRLA